MKLNQLRPGADIIVQMAMGKANIEFHITVKDRDDGGIYTTPYFRDGHPLELHVNANPNVVCNIFAEDSYSRKRVSWNNVKLNTMVHNDEVVYRITTMLFNSDSQSGERRDHERMIDEIPALVEDSEGKDQSVTIHDISDNGVSFYADSVIGLNHDRFIMYLEDKVGKQSFKFKLSCKIVRVELEGERTFFGCEVLEPPHDYLLYTFMYKLVSAANR